MKTKRSIHQAPRRASPDGFTLMELLVTISIIAILAALLMPAIRGVLKSGEEAEARSELSALVSAVIQYRSEYGKLPIPDSEQGQGADNNTSEYWASDSDSEAIVKALMGEHTSTIPNPRKRKYLSTNTAIEEGEFLDPWGKQYAMKFDSNYSGFVHYYNKKISAPVIAVSFGPDTQQGNPASEDDIVSYEFESQN